MRFPPLSLRVGIKLALTLLITEGLIWSWGIIL